MADMTPILIKDLAEQTTAADSDYMVIGGADAKKIKWSTIWGLIRDKLGIGTAALSTSKKTVKEAINELYTNIAGISGLDIQYGKVPGTDVESKAYVDVDVTFQKPFPAVPVVLVGLYSTSTGYGMGSLAASCAGATKTGCTIRIFNDGTAPRKPGINWIAIST